MAYRFALLITVLLGAYVRLAFQLYDLQLVHGETYRARADTQVLVSKSANGDRGTINFMDKNGAALPAATEKLFPVIYAVPKAIADASEAAHMVAPILNMSTSALEKIFAKPNDKYKSLVRKADPDAARKIADLNLKGVFADFNPERFYPLGPVASQLLGYVGPNAMNAGESGLYGIERFYDDKLNNVSYNLALTIDPNVQIEAEKILDALIAKNGATGGSVIVMDPQTGKILAMGSSPHFDPNSYSASPVANFKNPAVQNVYEPGSVFKVLTMAAGIDAGKLTPQTAYHDTGTVTVSGKKITNYDLKKHGPYGFATMANVIEYSINTGAVFAESRIGNDIFTSYMKKFGLDAKTGVDLPWEVAGNLKRLSPKEPQVAFATASYGQGVSVTPLGLIDAMAAIANGGNLVRPYVNVALEPQVVRRVLATSTAEEVSKMMVSAVDRAGIASIPGYSLAGKTGTAFIPDFVHGGYTDKVIDSFVGFGPTSAPRFIALIKIDTLPSTALAAESVVPAFKELAQYLINYYNIPPDRLAAAR